MSDTLLKAILDALLIISDKNVKLENQLIAINTKLEEINNRLKD